MPFHGVLAHVECEHFFHGIFFAQRHPVEPHVGANEVTELVVGNLPEPLEAGYLGIVAQFVDCRNALLVGVAVIGFHLVLPGLLLTVAAFALCLLLVTHAEQRCLQYVHVAGLYQFGEELEQECNHEQAYVHSVDIGISGYDYFVISQSVKPVLDIEGGLEQVELLVLVDYTLLHAIGIERLAAQREHGLRLHVAYLCNRTACRVALGDENHGFVAAVSLGVVEVHPAVAQLAVVQCHLLGILPGLFCHTCHGLAFAFRCHNLLQHGLGHIGSLVQVVVEFLFYVVVDELVDGGTTLIHHGTAKFYFCLRLEYRLYHLDADGRHHAVAYVVVLKILVVEFLDGARQCFAEGRLVSSSLRGMLPVDKRVELFAILRSVRQHHLDIGVLKVNERVKRLVGHVVVNEVGKAVSGTILLAVVHDGQSRVEVRIVLDHRLDVVFVEIEVLEQFGIGLETNRRAVVAPFGSIDYSAFFHELAALEAGSCRLAVTKRLYLKELRQGISGFQSHTVQSHRTLVVAVVKLPARIHLRCGIYHVGKRNAAAVVANGNSVVGKSHVNHVSMACKVLVDSVIHHFLKQHIYAVVGLGAVTKPAYIHTRPQAHMLERLKGHKVVVFSQSATIECVIVFLSCRFFCHLSLLLLTSKVTKYFQHRFMQASPVTLISQNAPFGPGTWLPHSARCSGCVY